MRHFHPKKQNLFSRLSLSRPRHHQPQGKPDYFLIGLIFGIVIFGLIMLSSASIVKSYQKNGSSYYFFWHQVVNGLIPGLILFFILSRINYLKWEKFSVWFFGASLLLLILVFAPFIGQTINKARSWISFFGLFPIQPAEIVKLLLILALAGWFSHRGREKNRDFWNGLIPFALLFALVSILVILQPDLGTLLILLTIGLAVYFVAGADFKHLLILGSAGVLALGIMIKAASYRADRLTTFINPGFDPQGIGYHINQALLAVGSGGIFGLGFGQSRQKFAYLPEAMGDSIFAVIAEELGFIFGLALIAAFLLMAWRGWKLCQKIPDDYGRYVVVGIISWFVFQAFFNIAAMINLMPLTGVPMPFVSYGGSAFAACLAGAGILASISRQARP